MKKQMTDHEIEALIPRGRRPSVYAADGRILTQDRVDYITRRLKGKDLTTGSFYVIMGNEYMGWYRVEVGSEHDISPNCQGLCCKGGWPRPLFPN